MTNPIPLLPEGEGPGLDLAAQPQRHGEFDPQERVAEEWFVRTLLNVHNVLLDLEANERTRTVVMKTMGASATKAEIFEFGVSMRHDPAVATILGELANG